MIVVMLPCFLLAMYEKHGQPLEVVIKNVIQTKFIRPKERPYQTENFYAVMERQRKLEKEVSAIVNGRTTNHDPRGKPSAVKRKLTRAEKKQIAAVIQAAKGDGKPHTAQQTIPYLQMYPDGICRVTEKKYSKSLVFEDINYQLAQADDKTAIFENWCDFLNYFDASVSVQLSFINQGASEEKRTGSYRHSGAGRRFQLYPQRVRGYAEKPACQRQQRACEKRKYITFSIEADNLGGRKSPPCPYRNRRTQQF